MEWLDQKKALLEKWFHKLRDDICSHIEKIEEDSSSSARFQRRPWSRNSGGGGVSSLIRGSVIEKAGVNISTVFGDFSSEMMKQMQTDESSFWASGISVVVHPSSPHIPSAHMNTRFIVNGSRYWFGGVADTTPCLKDQECEEIFHARLRESCDSYEPGAYIKFKEECDKYFYIPHRKCSRGSGGIFYDNLNSGDWERDLELTKNVGKAFKSGYGEIIKIRKDLVWSDREKQEQLKRRGLYTEFNLVYDRGTKFGFMTGGDVEAILMSLPPLASW